MCVIVYKPIGKKLPSTKTLKECFEHNPDGAGYMLPINNKAVIHKGFMNFNDFKEDIEKTIRDNKLDVTSTPIVLHFRISTQGGKQAGLCHPFPICRDYAEMRKLDNTSDMALCHNGIISHCSTSSYYGGHYDFKTKSWNNGQFRELDYNDTMTFIKDYASLVIDNDPYFALNDNKCELLERLCEYSKLAIMNSKGYVKLIGQFFERKGIYYSNLNHRKKSKLFNFKTCSQIIDDDEYFSYLKGIDDEELF